MIHFLKIPEGNPLENMVLILAQLKFWKRRIVLDNRFRPFCCREFITELRKQIRRVKSNKPVQVKTLLYYLKNDTRKTH